jgi:hypothetical protein
MADFECWSLNFNRAPPGRRREHVQEPQWGMTFSAYNGGTLRTARSFVSCGPI